MTEYLISHLEWAAGVAATWGPLLVIVLMAIESSVFPLPSEVVMLPAGFFAAKHDFFPASSPWTAVAIAIACGTLGSILGAYANYGVSLLVGRPFLHRWGKYFFLPPAKLERAEQLFREYGDGTTFVCRLIPVARHLISIPAGLSRMHFGRFTFFTGAGAAVWVTVLTLIGFWLGSLHPDMPYRELVQRGMDWTRENLLWILPACAAVFAGYVWVHRKVMGRVASKPAA